MLPTERNMVLSDWKRDLFEIRREFPWSVGRKTDLWCLLNFVIDNITLPSCTIIVGGHPDSMEVPMCWAATRDQSIIMMYARPSVREDRELAFNLEKAFLHELAPAVDQREHFNPFQELKR